MSDPQNIVPKLLDLKHQNQVRRLGAVMAEIRVIEAKQKELAVERAKLDHDAEGYTRISLQNGYGRYLQARADALTQQVQAVPAGAPQRQVDQSGGQPGVPDAHEQVDGTHQTNAQQAVDSARKCLGIAGVVGGQSRGVDPEQPTVGTHEGKLSGLINGVLQRIAVVPPDAVIQGPPSVPGGKTVLPWAGRLPDSKGRPGRHRQ